MVENWGVTKPDPVTGHVPPCSKCGDAAPVLIGDIPFCVKCGEVEYMYSGVPQLIWDNGKQAWVLPTD
jgi:hypothetical protein